MTGFGYSVLGFGSHPTRGPNDNLFNLASVKAIHETSGTDGVGRNFHAGGDDGANSGWMTGMQVIGSNMYISNRGNNNDWDSPNVYISRLAVTSTDGQITRRTGAIGLNSTDGFALSADGTKLILTDFHGGGVRSATIADDGSDSELMNVTLTGSAVTSQAGLRFARWNNDGSKYYAGYGLGNGSSRILQWTAATNYIVASGDSTEASQDLAIEAASDLIFNSDGTKMYLSRNTGYIYEYSLSSAYDTSSETLVTTFDVRDFFGSDSSASVSPWRASNSDSSNPWIVGISWNDDGSKLYAVTLWGTTLAAKVSNTVNPSSVTGEGGSRTNTFPVIEFSVQ